MGWSLEVVSGEWAVMSRTFLVPVESFVADSGPMKGRTGYRPKYSNEIGYGYETHHGIPPDKGFWLIDIRPELATEKQLQELAGKADVIELTDSDDTLDEQRKGASLARFGTLPIERSSSGKELIASLRESVMLKQRGFTDQDIASLHERRRTAPIDAAVRGAIRASD